MSEVIDVIEVRKARNGYVLCAFMVPYGANRDKHMISGYATYVVEGNDPESVGKAVAAALREYPITTETAIPPARTLP